MKKGIIVLLIAVLVAGVAFAGTLKGSAGLSFKVDLDEKTWGFSNDKAWQYSFDFEFDTTKVEVGEHKTDLWAELAISGSATTGLDKAADAAGEFHGAYAVKLTKAEIHYGENLVFGLLNSGAAADYAKHYSVKVGGALASAVKGPGAAYLPGFTVKYKDITGGFGAKGQWNDDDSFYNLFGHVEVPVKINDELTVAGAAYFALSNQPLLGGDWANRTVIGGAAKAGYKAEKISGNVAADLQFNKPNVENEDGKFLFEVAADGAYKLNDKDTVSLNVYATPGRIFPVADTAALYVGDYEKSLKLDAKAAAGYTIKSDDNMEIGVSGYVEVTDALIDKREITVSATETVKLLEKKALALTFSETYKIFAKTLKLTAKAEYTAEKFVAWVEAKDISFKFGDEVKVTAIKIEAGIKSTKIIENAEIGLKYTGADFAKNAADEITKKGAVTAYVTIAFPQ
ncbi:MAG: hypothetical protein J5599_01540 [Spirochaetales bacterium]|nr:hypothetical protein [Spirochaetales bacterium]